MLNRIGLQTVKRGFASAAVVQNNKTVDPAARINDKAKRDIEDVRWIQDLLNSSEGGGYIAGNAGILAMPVAWGDLDSFNHVNNVRYLKWFEEARVNMFNRYTEQKPGCGFESFMSLDGVGPIIRSVELAWRRPITFPDTITVVHKLAPITQPDRFDLHGVVVSHNSKTVAARIKETIVTVDYPNGGRKAPIPENILQAFHERLEEQGQYK